MQFLEHIPSFPLNLAIEKIWYCKSDSLKSGVTTFPLLNEEIIIDFSDYYETISSDNNRLVEENSAWISGIQTDPTKTKFEGKHEQYGILFRPGGVNMILGFNANNLTNKTIKLSEIFGVRFNELKDYLKSSVYPKQNLKIIELFIRKSFSIKPVNRILQNALNLNTELDNQKGILKNYIEGIDWSSKSFIQNFKKVFGVTPKKFFHIKQINNSLHEIHNSDHSLTHIGLNNGFYDQSHFIRVFKSILQITPKEYKLQITKGKVDISLPNYLNH